MIEPKTNEDKWIIAIRAKTIILFKRTLLNSLRLVYPYVKKCLPPPEEYCEEVQEIYHKFFGTLIERDYGENKEKWEMIRDISCLGLDYSKGYLLRLLDAVAEVDMEKLKITASKEILKPLSYKFKKLDES